MCVHLAKEQNRHDQLVEFEVSVVVRQGEWGALGDWESSAPSSRG